MNEGFKPFMDDAEFTLGALDPDDDEAKMTVETKDGTWTCDTVGIDEIAGVPNLILFNWKELNEETIEQIVEETPDLTMDEVTEEISLGEPTCVLEKVIPYREVTEIDMESEVFE